MDLLTLGKVINALSDKRGRLVPPYRDSSLTWVLRDVLGGNCRSTILLPCSAHETQYSSTQNTLEFGDHCKGIQKFYTVAEKKLSTAELVSEVQRLQRQLYAAEESEANKTAHEAEMEVRAAHAEQDAAAKVDKAKALSGRLHKMSVAFEKQRDVIQTLTNEKNRHLTGRGSTLKGLQQQMAVKVLRFVCVCWRDTELFRALSSWKIQHEIAAGGAKAAHVLVQTATVAKYSKICTILQFWQRAADRHRITCWRTGLARAKTRFEIARAASDALAVVDTKKKAIQASKGQLCQIQPQIKALSAPMAATILSAAVVRLSDIVVREHARGYEKGQNINHSL